MDLQTEIEQAFEHYEKLDCQNAQQHLHEVLRQILDHLEVGQLRVAEKINGQWQTHEWLKKAILLCFRMYPNQVIDGQFARFFDKIPLQYRDLEAPQFNDRGIRIVPPACVRRGAYIGQNTVLMPSYVNIGAYVDSGCMIDTWATVGSCAQIGKNVHLSGGAGIGGVLEPLQATPTIIEDNCFIGARSEIVEGVIVEQGSVIAMGVFISQSTKIYHRETGEITYGRIPAGSVVVPGSLPAANGHYHLNCAIIVKQVDAKTRAKTSINELLRNSNLC